MASGMSTAAGCGVRSSNWTDGFPGAGEDTAVFGTALSSATTATVTLDSSRSLSGLGFNTSVSGASYLISSTGTSTLTLSNTAGAATISNSGGSQTINAPIVLGSNLDVTASAGSVLTIAQTISESSTGTSLSFGGSGVLILSGTDSYTGGTNVSSGTLAIAGGSALPSTGVVTLERQRRVAPRQQFGHRGVACGHLAWRVERRRLVERSPGAGNARRF